MSVRNRDWTLAFIVMAAAGVLWLLPLALQPQHVPFWPGAEYSDLLISHWPNALWTRQSIAEWGQIPLWNPNILSGIPFAADPLSGLWYLPNWLAVVFPAAITFNAIFWLHLAWAGLGAWALARQEGLSTWGALIVGLVFAGTPKFVTHIALGHLGLVSAVSWTPWVLLLMGVLVRRLSTAHHWLRWSALLGAALGLVFLADPRWLIPVGILVLSYGLCCILRDRPVAAPLVKRSILSGAVVAMIAAATAACLALPLWEFLQHSTRSGLSSGERAIFSLPLEGLLGTISVMDRTPEWLAYFGASVLVIAALSLTRADRRPWFWVGVTVVCTILALGPITPLYSLLGVIPGADVLRVPARFLFISALGWAFLAGYGIDALISLRHSQTARNVKIGLFAVTCLILAINLAVWLIGGVNSIRPFGPAITAILAFILVTVYMAGRISLERVLPLLLGVIVLDLLWINIGLLEPRAMEDVFADKSALFESIEADHGTSRLFSPSYSVPQPQGVLNNVELSDGVNPLQLSSYRDYMEEAVGLDAGTYDVTLPSYPEGNPDRPWGFQVDGEALARLNVEWIASAYALEDAALDPSGIVDGVYLYRLEGVGSRAWMEEGTPGEALDQRSVSLTQWTPNWIRLQTSGPGNVVLSEVAYPGWRVFVDGELVTLKTVDGLFRSVAVDSGEHDVLFQFFPRTLLLGLAISGAGLLVLLYLWIRR